MGAYEQEMMRVLLVEGVQALGVTLGICFILEGIDSIVNGCLTGR